MDDLIGDLGRIDYVKLDVQGAELDVIRGATKALQQACVIQVSVFIQMGKRNYSLQRKRVFGRDGLLGTVIRRNS